MAIERSCACRHNGATTCAWLRSNRLWDDPFDSGPEPCECHCHTATQDDDEDFAE